MNPFISPKPTFLLENFNRHKWVIWISCKQNQLYSLYPLIYWIIHYLFSAPSVTVRSSLFSSVASKKARLSTSSVAERAAKEMKRYLGEDPVGLEYNPLQWWRPRAQLYPHLAILVRKSWCLPASSVRSEEVFSVAGDILRPKRARLLPENVNKLVFLSENITEKSPADEDSSESESEEFE